MLAELHKYTAGKHLSFSTLLHFMYGFIQIICSVMFELFSTCVY